MQELFPKTVNFQVVRLSSVDAEKFSDHLINLRNLILENEPMYPNIGGWFDRKVISGVKSSERIAYIGYVDEEPAVSAVIKRGESTKFCHLKIRENLQDIHLGEAFFALMGLEARSFAKEVHFTLPESLWEKEKEFFKTFGFIKAIKSRHQYRLFEDELRCSSPFSRVWDAVLEKLPKIARIFSLEGYSLDNRVLMSIKAKYAEKVLSGEKRVEVRKKFSKKWSGHKVSLYASRPKSSLVGQALISKVIIAKPNTVWDKFGDQIGCTKEEFKRYVGSVSEVYAVVLEHVTPYRNSIPLKEVSNLTKKQLRPPQNYYNLDQNRDWIEAVSMGAFLQSRFGTPEQVFL